MAYKFQKDFAILSGAIEPAANNDPTLALGGVSRAWSDLYLSGTLYGAAAVGTHPDSVATGFFDHMAVTSSLTIPEGKFRIGAAAVTSTAGELNKLAGAGGAVTAAKLTTLSALTDGEIAFVDGAGLSVVGGKVVVATAGKDVTSLRSVTGSAILLNGLAGPHAISASAGDVAIGKDLVLGNAGQYGISRAGQLDIASMGTNWTNAGRTVANLGTVQDATSITSTAFVGPIDGIVGGNTPAAGTFSSLVAGGNVDLGDATTDTITATGQFDSDLIPSADSARSLGSNAKRWSTIYVDSIVGASTSFDVAYVAGGASIAADTDFALVTSAGTVTMPGAAAGKYLYIKSSVDGNVILAASGSNTFPEGAPTLRATGSAILCIAKDVHSWFIL